LIKSPFSSFKASLAFSSVHPVWATTSLTSSSSTFPSPPEEALGFSSDPSSSGALHYQFSIPKVARLHILITTLHQVLETLGDTILESTGGVGLLGGLAASGELGLGRELSGRIGVFGSGFTENDVGIGCRGLVDLGVGDDEQDVLGPSDGDSLNTVDLFQACEMS
jgi:hypothetical protein